LTKTPVLSSFELPGPSSVQEYSWTVLLDLSHVRFSLAGFRIIYGILRSWFHLHPRRLDPASTAELVKPKTIVEARSLAILLHSNKRVQVQDATIRGPLDLTYTTTNQQVSLVNCEFEDPADFSYATFQRHLILQNSTFKKGLDLEGATVDLNARFDAIKVLSGNARFRYLHVQGLLWNMHNSSPPPLLTSPTLTLTRAHTCAALCFVVGKLS
jgi:Pentapeptide repeats (9 copies)